MTMGVLTGHSVFERTYTEFDAQNQGNKERMRGDNRIVSMLMLDYIREP